MAGYPRPSTVLRGSSSPWDPAMRNPRYIPKVETKEGILSSSTNDALLLPSYGDAVRFAAVSPLALQVFITLQSSCSHVDFPVMHGLSRKQNSGCEWYDSNSVYSTSRICSSLMMIIFIGLKRMENLFGMDCPEIIFQIVVFPRFDRDWSEDHFTTEALRFASNSL